MGDTTSEDKICVKFEARRRNRANSTAQFLAREEEEEVASSSSCATETEIVDDEDDAIYEPPPKQLCTPNRSHKRMIKTRSKGF